MSSKSTLVAALLMVALGSWYWFYEVKGKNERDKAKEDGKLVFQGLDTGDIAAVTIRQNGQDLSLKKVGGTWTLMSPIQAATDSQSVDALLDSLKTLKKEDSVDDLGTQLAEFGLLSPSATVQFESGTKTAKAIHFGSDNPTGQYSYVQVPGEKPIFMVMKYSKSNICKEAKDLRDKKVLDFQAADVVKVQSQLGKGLALERSKNSAWKLSKPFSELGKEDSINSWLQQVLGLRVDTFVDEKGGNLAKYGLGASAAKLEFSLAGKDKPVVLYQGRKLDGNKGRYYRVEGKPLVFSMAEYAGTTLDKKADDLADRDAFSFKSYEVSRFELVRGAKTLKAAKKDNQWAWDPAQAKSDFDFFSFLSGLSTANLKARLPKDTKIATPAMVLTLYGDKDAVLEKITVGGKGKQGLIALSQTKAQAVEIADDLFSKLPQ